MRVWEFDYGQENLSVLCSLIKMLLITTSEALNVFGEVANSIVQL